MKTPPGQIGRRLLFEVCQELSGRHNHNDSRAEFDKLTRTDVLKMAQTAFDIVGDKDQRKEAQMRTLKFQSRVLILSGWAMLMLILTLGVLSWQSQAALAKPLHTDVGGEIAADTTWTLAGSPYILTSDVVITTGVTLTVEPGVVVMGQGSIELRVLGHLEAIGTATEPITFTSSSDSGPRQWSGLVFDGGTGDLRHVTVRYGGDSNNIGLRSNITARNVLTGEVHIESSRVLSESCTSSCTDYGMYVSNSQVVVSDTLISGNGDTYRDYALYVTGASTILTVTGSTFQDNIDWAARMEASHLHQVQMTDNTFSGNGKDRVLIIGGSMEDRASLTFQNGLEGYELEGDLTVPNGVTLTIEPGVVVMGQGGTGLKVLGHLEAIGTATEPITFTSSADSGSYQWSGLIFDGGTGDLRHVTVRYGGSSTSIGIRSNITARDVLTGEVRIESSRVLSESCPSSCTDYGLYVSNSQVVVSDTLISGNGIPIGIMPSMTLVPIPSSLSPGAHSRTTRAMVSTQPTVPPCGYQAVPSPVTPATASISPVAAPLTLRSLTLPSTTTGVRVSTMTVAYR